MSLLARDVLGQIIAKDGLPAALLTPWLARETLSLFLYFYLALSPSVHLLPLTRPPARPSFRSGFQLGPFKRKRGRGTERGGECERVRARGAGDEIDVFH